MPTHSSSLRSLLVTGLLTCSASVSALRLRQNNDVTTQATWPRCPDVWRIIAEELKYWFIDEEGLCSDLAAQAVRLPFHDCFPSGGCDGSIILTDECTTRVENSQLIPICGVLYKMTLDYGVGAADLINFAGCEFVLIQTAHGQWLIIILIFCIAVANKACPWGPYIPFYIGRKDNATASDPGQLPPPTLDAPTLVRAFQARNFSSIDLVALTGAHSCGGNSSFVPFDTTPGEMDSPAYYSQVLTGSAPTILPADKNLALDPSTTDA